MLLLLLYPWPTSSHRVNPSDSSMDLQGAAIEDLGEAGTHLGRKGLAGEEPSGSASGSRASGQPVNTYVHLGGRRKTMAG